jgi:hypothetical protein
MIELFGQEIAFTAKWRSPGGGDEALLLAAAALAALTASAQADALPKGLLGAWCGGEVETEGGFKGSIPYGRPLENGKCSNGETRLTLEPHRYREQDRVCIFERVRTRFDSGMAVITFYAKCTYSNGWYYERGTVHWHTKALNVLWVDDSC